MTANNEPDVSAVLAAAHIPEKVFVAPIDGPCPRWEPNPAAQAIRRLAWQWRREGIAAIGHSRIYCGPVNTIGLCSACRELTVCDAALAALEVG